MMRRAVLFAVVGGLVLNGATAAELKPSGGGPLFRIFASGAGSGGGAPKLSIAGSRPLLVISTVADVQLSRDRQAVRVTLTPADAKRFADVTRQHARDFLIIEANGKVLEAMQVTSPVK